METTPLNVIIVGELALVVNGLKHKIMQKFGSAVNATVICDFQNCLKKVDKSTHLVVTDRQLEGKDLFFITRHIRAINPDVEVMVHDEADEVLREISALLRQRLVPEAAAVFAVA